jgi:carboxymethylenebutenolidase
MSAEAISIGSNKSGAATAWLAVPAAGSGPGLLVVEEDAAARALAELFAAEGYVALGLPRAPSADSAGAALAALRERGECTGKLAVLGCGPGAGAALAMAAAGGVEAVIGYDPPADDGNLDFAARAPCPLMLHFAGDGPAVASGWLERLKSQLAGRAEVALHVYPAVTPGFEQRRGAGAERAAAGLAHSRTIALLRRVLGPQYDLESLWEAHTRYEFETRDVAATMATMIAEPYVNHIPVMTGGVGQAELARFYANHFIPKCPADFTIVPISRTVGADRIVDEMLTTFTHDVEIDWMLPGVPPTGRRVEIVVVAIVGFRGDKLWHEHIYWDQASVLVQIGLLDPAGLPVAGAETARKVVDEALPSNTLMRRWAESAPAAER